ncbi:hypothetical protein BKA62DRAFT_789567 [Auriculariales sp. MPI-PUGE-AT-0066]|nr:hypothetical protein BKA62DRAFT_789567 [Auriculariales sp. MPI-PUGE-AT-0066]
MFANAASILALTAVIIAAPVKRACNALPFDMVSVGGSYETVYGEVTLPKVPEGTTITATVVNLATCEPYNSLPAVTELWGNVIDLDGIYGDHASDSVADVKVEDTNTVSFVSSVPSGSTSLTNWVQAYFKPYNDANAAYVKANVGVLVSAT